METMKDQSPRDAAVTNNNGGGTAAATAPQGGGGGSTEAFADGVRPHPHHEELHAHADIPADLPRVRTWGVALAGLVVVAALAGLFMLGWVPREKRLAELHEETVGVGGVDDRPNVQVARPKRSAPTVDLVLPADARANQETAVFARANGYLKRYTVDIGDKVKAGQLLAEIDAPDVDAELVQAQASVGQAKANVVKAQSDLELARTTMERYEGFSKTGGVSQQEIDEKRAAFAQAKSALEADRASVAAAEATVQRLTALQGFEKVYAPFAGVVTARSMDVGALVSSTNQTTPLFRVADTDVLRVYVNVPQSYVESVRAGDKVALAVRNYPGREFEGVVARTAGALDPATRTLRYEVDVPNKDGVLLAGMYGEVRIKAKQEDPPMIVPTSAVVFDAGGTKVWVVDQGKVYQKRVDVGRDFGTEIEVSKGLTGEEEVVTNPGERLADGVEVEAKVPPQQEQQASAR